MSNELSVLKKCISANSKWADVTRDFNKRLGSNLSLSAVKSLAYRNNLSLSVKDTVPKTRKQTIEQKYGITSDDDIPCFTIKAKNEWVPIWSVGDMHAGSENFDEDAFLQDRDYALANGMYLLGVGDWLETAIPGHMPKTVFGQKFSPEAQRDYVAETLIDFKGKTIAIVDGNHERRISDATSFKPLQDVAGELEALHMEHGGVVIVNVNGIDYKLLIKHGSSFAKNNKELCEWGTIYKDVDVVLSGHTHICEAFTMNGGFEIVNGKKIKTKQIGVRCGHYLSYKGYVEEKPFKPLESESIVLWLNSKTKEVLVSKIRSEYSLV